jgi:uncharacterized protein YigE (DUF2233 family)
VPPRSPRKKNRVMRAAIFVAIVAAALALVMVARRPRVPRVVGSHIPTGGAAASTTVDAIDGGGSALIEDARRYAVRVWSFPLDRYDVRVEDAAMSTALDRVLKETQSDFVVNGGFFDPSGNPVGLVISDGVVLSKLGRNLSGGVLTLTPTNDGLHAELFAAETFAIPDGGRFAIQCRPRLVVDHAPNVKSDDGKRAERTALCARDGGSTLDVVIVRGSDDGESAGPSLFALAKHLSEIGCEAALNLDGGPSTGAAWREGEAVRLLAPRGPVRHVIAFREHR